MTIKAKAVRVLTWALGAILVSAGVAWAATLWRVDSYGNIRAARSTVLLSAGEASNCKLDISGTTLSIVGTNDAALSVSNPCLVGMPNGAEPLVFSAPVSVTDGAAGDMAGNTFGLTAGVIHAEALPFFVHACDGNLKDYFGISRNNIRVRTSTAAASLAQKGDTDADDAYDMFIMESGLTLADEVDRTCVTIGSFRASMSAGNEWTVTAFDELDGLGRFQVGRQFLPALGQYGNQSGKFHNVADGATSLVFANQNAFYSLDESGYYDYYLRVTNATNGADGTAVRFYLPMPAAGSANRSHMNDARYYSSSAGAGIVEVGGLSAFAGLMSATASSVSDNVFSGGGSSYVIFHLRYQANGPAN